MKKKSIIKLILIITWMSIIFLFSAQNATESGNTSSSFIIKIAEFIKNDKLTIEEKNIIVDKYGLIIRKLAHFTIYFILAFLVFIFLHDYMKLNYKIIIWTIFICLLYAISDEIHQYYVPGRAASAIDVIIDTSGAALSTFIFYKFSKLKEKRI